MISNRRFDSVQFHTEVEVHAIFVQGVAPLLNRVSDRACTRSSWNKPHFLYHKNVLAQCFGVMSTSCNCPVQQKPQKGS